MESEVEVVMGLEMDPGGKRNGKRVSKWMTVVPVAFAEP